MHIVIGNFNFIRPAGTETYVMTVGERLSRLGHEVWVLAMELGPLADVARRRGLRVTGAVRELPERCDVALVQDGPSAYALAERYPRTPQVLRATSAVFDLSHPPRLPGLVRAVVSLHGHTEAQMRAFATDAEEFVRLRQPVDTDRFAPRSPLPEHPRRALLLGNYLRGQRRAVLLAAWEALGIEFVEAGRHAASFRTDVETLMNEVDIVVGKSRVIVEAMASGRAAYVYDDFGTDGWVTTDSYEALCAETFDGQATDRVPDAARLAADLAAYDPAMGLVNRDLAVRHHSVARHVEQLIAVLERHAQPHSEEHGATSEMAWLARQNWLTESRAYDLGLEAEAARAELRRVEAERDGLRAEIALARRDLATAAAVAGSLRYRLAGVLAAPVDALRERRRRPAE